MVPYMVPCQGSTVGAGSPNGTICCPPTNQKLPYIFWTNCWTPIWAPCGEGGCCPACHAWPASYTTTRLFSYENTFLLLQDFSPTTRLLSYYKTFLLLQDFSPTTVLLLQDFSPTTRLFSYYKTFLLLQDFSPTARLFSYYKTFLLLQDFSPTTRLLLLQDLSLIHI